MQNRLGAPHPSAAMHISSLIAALGCGAPRRNGEIHICRNTGISAKGVNYFCGNMKDATMPDFHNSVCLPKRSDDMKEALILLVVVAGWFVLQRYILPKFGIST